MGAKEKGIIDLMNTQKVKKIDRRDLSNVFKDIEDEAKINLLNNWIERLRTCAREDCIFPLAGQDFMRCDICHEGVCALTISTRQGKHLCKPCLRKFNNGDIDIIDKEAK